MLLIENVVFVHGWGLNKAVWGDYIEAFMSRFPNLNVHNIDIPGYGDQAHVDSTANLEELARACLEQAPKNAVWIGWSLGGMITMQAALLGVENNNQQIQAMQLINSTPKFVQSDDWACGVDIEIFRKFSADLARDYSKTLSTFLLLQAGASRGARQLARDAQEAISRYDNPSEVTLSKGIDCLAMSDLRNQLQLLTQPSQVVLGKLDRVTKPDSSLNLAALLGADLIEVSSGHAPFMTHEAEMLNAFEVLLNKVEQGLVS